MRQVKVIAIIGPSGVGKSSVLRQIMQKDTSIKLIPTYTDRLPRGDEVDCGHVFVSTDQFDNMVDSGEFRFVKQPFSQPFRYGVRDQDLEQQGRLIILLRSFILDDFYRTFPSGFVVNIFAPIETAISRMNARGDSDQSIKKRLVSYEEELAVGEALADLSISSEEVTANEIAEIILRATEGEE